MRRAVQYLRETVEVVGDLLGRLCCHFKWIKGFYFWCCCFLCIKEADLKDTVRSFFKVQHFFNTPFYPTHLPGLGFLANDVTSLTSRNPPPHEYPLHCVCAQMFTSGGDEDHEDVERGHNRRRELTDDGISHITADDYKEVRLIPVLAEFAAQTPYQSAFLNVVNWIVIALSVCSSVFVSFNLVEFIPMALGFGSAILGWVNHTQVEIHLTQINGAANKLQKLLIWWNSLSVIQKRIPFNKEYLITTTEALMLAKIVGGQSYANDDPKPKEGGADGKGEGGGKQEGKE